MGKKKTADMSASVSTEPVEQQTVKPVKKTVKKEKTEKVVAVEAQKNTEKEAVKETKTTEATETPAESAKTKAPRTRGKRYVAARSRVDKTIQYSPKDAVALAKKTHVGHFPGSLEAHCVVKDTGIILNVAFPHSTGKSVSVAIANDEVLAELDKGIINFSILLAHPSMMPKIAKYARLLGPKGLMPNPKNNTVTPDPEKRKTELEGGSTAVKTERKAPLMHVMLGKLSQPEDELAANLDALIKAFAPGKLVRCSISASMGPGIKVATE